MSLLNELLDKINQELETKSKTCPELMRYSFVCQSGKWTYRLVNIPSGIQSYQRSYQYLLAYKYGILRDLPNMQGQADIITEDISLILVTFHTAHCPGKKYFHKKNVFSSLNRNFNHFINRFSLILQK